jgi:hypothetical protein
VTDRDRRLDLETTLSLEELSAYGYRNDGTGTLGYRTAPLFDDGPPRRPARPSLRLIPGGRGA